MKMKKLKVDKKYFDKKLKEYLQLTNELDNLLTKFYENDFILDLKSHIHNYKLNNKNKKLSKELYELEFMLENIESTKDLLNDIDDHIVLK